MALLFYILSANAAEVRRALKSQRNFVRYHSNILIDPNSFICLYPRFLASESGFTMFPLL
jgi:hypothetical protein